MSGRLGMTGDASVRGDKEFGRVQAGLSKSYIPGVGYKAATAIPKTELRALARGKRATMAAGVRAKERAHSAQQRELERQVREHHRAIRNPSPFQINGGKQPDIPLGSGRHAAHFQFNTLGAGEMGQAKAVAYHAGGRKSGIDHVLSRHDADTHTLQHEAAHLKPRRSSYRSRNFTPVQQAREEARADMASGNPKDYHRRSSFKAVAAGSSQYALAGRNPIARSIINRATVGAKGPVKEGLFGRSGMQAYRDTQDKIAASRKRPIGKAATLTMSDADAHRLAQRYDTRGPLPKKLSREAKMKAYEARYIASGGRKAEKWKHRASAAEVGRNVGLAGATLAGAGILAHKAPGIRRLPRHALEHAAVASGTFGGASELYGEHARSRRASYQNSPAGVAGSALTRMQAYTPGKKS